jgi:dATP pyrophosphohydrolase
MSTSPQGPSGQKVQVWVFFQEPDSRVYRFLLLQTTEARRSFWQPVTGSVELGEKLADAALREAREETGLQFTSDPFCLNGTEFEYEARGIHWAEIGFGIRLAVSAEQCGPPPVRLDPHEHVAFQWVTAQEAVQQLGYESNRRVLKGLLSVLAAGVVPGRKSRR